MISVNIKLQIGRYLDYLGYLFPPDPQTGHYKVTATSDLGKILIAYAAVSDSPVSLPGTDKDEKVVTLDLPLSLSTQNLQDKWLYFSSADTERIAAYIKASFNMDFIAYYLRGKVMGYQKKDVIEMYIVSRKLISVDPYDALHKRVYRLEQKKMSEMTRQLLRKAYYFEENLDVNGLL